MDGPVIVLAMDTNGVSEGKIYFLKASDWGTQAFFIQLIVILSLNMLTIVKASSLTGKIKTHKSNTMMVFYEHIWFTA